MNIPQHLASHIQQYQQDNIIGLFPQPLFNTSLDLDADEVAYLKSAPMRDVGNGQSSEDPHILPKTPKLYEQVSNKADLFISKLEYDFPVKMQTSWTNLHKKGDWCHNHIHTNSMISGVLFLDTPPNTGEFCLKTPGSSGSRLFTSVFTFNYKKSNIYNNETYRVIPRTGQCLFFPSYMVHYVTANPQDLERWTVSFNFFAQGSVGDGINETEFPEVNNQCHDIFRRSQ
jgi:uncharacterized protein (TIGR02466 family)